MGVGAFMGEGIFDRISLYNVVSHEEFHLNTTHYTILASLHWLPVHFRVDFQRFNNLAPPTYLLY